MTLSPALRRAAEESKAKYAEPLRDEPTIEDLRHRITFLEGFILGATGRFAPSTDDLDEEF